MTPVLNGAAVFVCVVSVIVALCAACLGIGTLLTGPARQRFAGCAILLSIVVWAVLRVWGMA